MTAYNVKIASQKQLNIKCIIAFDTGLYSYKPFLPLAQQEVKATKM